MKSLCAPAAAKWTHRLQQERHSFLPLCLLSRLQQKGILSSPSLLQHCSPPCSDLPLCPGLARMPLARPRAQFWRTGISMSCQPAAPLCPALMGLCTVTAQVISIVQPCAGRGCRLGPTSPRSYLILCTSCHHRHTGEEGERDIGSYSAQNPARREGIHTSLVTS